MSSTSPRDRSDWVTLLAGVRVSRAWMTRETPDLLAAWRDAPSPKHRRAIATRILQIATDLESEIDDVDDAAAEPAVRELAIRIDTRLVHGPDWLPLAAALTRAATAGYDLAVRLPALAAAAPLPARHPARELHWRLLDDCPAALPTLSLSSDSTVTAEGTPVAPTGPSRPQMSRDTPAIGRTDPASNQPTSQDRRSS